MKADVVINTFRYIFNKFKKGIFVKILNNELKVFLPFSKVNFTNEWSDKIKVDPSKYNSINQFLEYITKLSGYNFNPKTVNNDISVWYANNCIVRYDLTKDPNTGYYYPTEGDSNVGNIKNMLETLCAKRKIPDIEFFLNRRDFPILKRNETEPYNNIWDSQNQLLVSHNYPQYSPILSMCSSDEYADVCIPTWEDWARVQSLENIWFPKSCKNYQEKFNNNWDSKIPTAIFRGGTTGCGVTIETNMRLKACYLSTITAPDENGVKYLDAGITNWNLRPRKIEGQEYLQTIDIKKLPFNLSPKLTPTEQSN